MIFRIRFVVAGGHVHASLFAGHHEGALGKAGDFCLRNEEFAAFREAATFVQFVDNSPGGRNVEALRRASEGSR